MSPSCPSNRVLGSLLFGVGKPRKKRPLPLRHRETPTVNLQFTSVSLSNQAPLHLNKLSHKVRLLSFFNPLFKGGRSCPEFSISSKKKKKKMNWEMPFKGLYTPSVPQITWQTMLWCVSCLGAGPGSRAESPQSDKHSLSSPQPWPGGEWKGKMYNLCLGYSCRASHRQGNGNIIEWPQL